MMKTKRKILLMFALLIAISALPLSAQDFKLFYAKNVTDVTAFRNLAELDKQLNWREVSNGAIDGNLDDVRQVKDMLAETRMKGLEDQQLFWRMRDEMLLCFRIDDTSNTGGSFRVEVVYGQDEDGKDIKKTLTTRKYFFANMPLACDEISINVWRVKDPTQRINFRYWVYDWDDDNVYIFQLDQKRQATGDTYKMEYVTSYMDSEGDIHSQSNVLELKETKFQSFYVPEGQSLTDVYFLTGNKGEGDVKLRMDMDEIHPNIDIDHQLEVPSLLATFKLSKHENRELMNFNWVGTGLFEKYDTLYIKLFNEKGMRLRLAGMSVAEGAFHDVISIYFSLNSNTALYHPNYNALFIVPAWLNSPAYEEGANSAYNYATLEVFAHEMTHAFDTEGTTYDKFGDPGTLWTSAADGQQFNNLAQRLADYHSTFEVAPGVMADGQHTISEDIADLGGFEIAFQTYTDHLTSHGFYGDELRRQQRLFFQAYAHIWRARYTDAYAQERVTGDIHSLPRERVNALVPHTDAWYDLFNVKPGDNLYIAPENRVHIW